MTPYVAVWRNKFAKGWNASGDQVEAHPVVELSTALADRYRTDAHFVPYTVRGADGERFESIPRVNLAGLAELRRSGCEVVFGGVVFDIDAPDHTSSPAWRAAEEAKLAELRLPFATYWTRGGYRVLFALPEEVAAERYVELWARLRVELREVGIVADELRDWTRCYRLPNVLRGGEVETADVRGELAPVTLSELAVVEEGDEPSAFAGIERVREPFQLSDRIEANRNTTLTRLAGKLRQTGLEPPEILAALAATAELRAPDWTPERGELAHIAESVGRYAAPELERAVEPPSPVENDDIRFELGSGVEVARHTGESLEDGGEALVYDRSRLWKYRKTGVWEELSDDVVKRLVAAFDGEWIRAGWDKKADCWKVKPYKVGKNVLDDVYGCLTVAKTRRGFFDDAADGIAFANAFVRLEGSEVRVEPPSPSWRATSRLPFAYSAGAEPALFVRTLRELFAGSKDAEDRIRLIREFIGTCFLGIATRYQKGLILLGDGGNGKSTILDVVRALFVDEAISAIAPQDMAQEYRRAMLADARVNLVSELPESDIIESAAAMKAAISGDAMVGRFIREQPFTFRPRAGHIMAANDLPASRDLSRGFFRRFLVVKFERELREDEQDRNRVADIVETELGAVASWAIDGAADLAARGRFDVPESSNAELAEWRTMADSVARFVADACIRTEEPRAGAAELYTAFCNWAAQTGAKRLTSHKFGRRLGRLGIAKTRRSSGFMYHLALSAKSPVHRQTPEIKGENP